MDDAALFHFAGNPVVETSSDQSTDSLGQIGRIWRSDVLQLPVESHLDAVKKQQTKHALEGKGPRRRGSRSGSRRRVRGAAVNAESRNVG